MGDIIFKCPACEKDLSVSDKGAGMSVPCPECGRPIFVPWPDIRFSCSSCGQPLSATFDLANELVACTKCNQNVRVPDSCQECNLPNTYSNDDHAQTKTCPFCFGKVPYLAQKCQHCGEFLIRRSTGLRRLPFLLVSCGITLLYFVLALLCFMVEKLSEDQEFTFAFAAILFFIIVVFQTISNIQRLKNMGASPWWCLLGFIPLINIFLYLRLFVCQEGYTETNRLDAEGHFYSWVIFILIIIVPLFCALIFS